jgi:hypothetical protein
VEKSGKHKHGVEKQAHQTHKTEIRSSKPEKAQERHEVQKEIECENTSMFPEFALTFQQIIPTAKSDDLPEDDDLIWVMTSETNPNLEFLTGVLASKINESKKCKPSSSKRYVRDSRSKSARTTSLSKLEAEPAMLVDSGKKDSVSSRTEFEVKSTRLDDGSSETFKQTPTIQMGSTMTPINFKIKKGELKLADP